jgi:DNA mismatch endonuclease (patch repair protein)
MRGNVRTGTRPELVVRRLLHRLGYRYRLHAPDLPGKPDIVFRQRKIALFVHGCFWHQHPSAECPLRSKPQSNVPYWNAKLARNVERDAENRATLEVMGWRAEAIWECQTRDVPALELELKKVLARRAAR